MPNRTLDQARFSNSFVEELKGETAPGNRPRQVPGVCYSLVEPTPVSDPHLLAWSDDVAEFLKLEKPEVRGPVVKVLAGNARPPGAKPFAARYGGHQFGNWAGQLGDGRAISLGEVEARDGSKWELQWKGAGPTPYSRRADGRAVLRSSLREWLCSEAMHHLGVPTTRALSLVGTGDQVVRDMFYSGDAKDEPGAVVVRVAPTFIRFGNFQIMATLGEIDNLRALANYTVRHHFPELIESELIESELIESELIESELIESELIELKPSESELGEATYLRWFDEVCRRTAIMIAHWMSVGFVHGVMNTDNMSILGLTIDYGPYGWLEPYEPDWTPNTTDFGQHRYAFGQQPRVALWNLMRLAQALIPLVSNAQDLGRGLETYSETFASAYHERMLQKLGLTDLLGEEDAALIDELEAGLEAGQIDMTIFFRELSHLAIVLLEESTDQLALFRELIAKSSYAAPGDAHETLELWFHRYAQRLRRETADAPSIRDAMLGKNPKYVLRNYLAQRAIEGAEAGDLSFLNRLIQVLKTPYEEHPEHEELAAKRPEWARTKAGCATLSCSS